MMPPCPPQTIVMEAQGQTSVGEGLGEVWVPFPSWLSPEPPLPLFPGDAAQRRD